MRTTPAVLLVLAISACSHASADRDRVHEAARAVLDHVDPARAAVILAQPQAIDEVREIVGSTRRVELVADFARNHPTERVPYNIAFHSAATAGPAVRVSVHVQAISHPPPGVPACGTGYVFEATKVQGEWVLRPVHVTVC